MNDVLPKSGEQDIDRKFLIFLFRKILHPGNTEIWWTQEQNEIEQTARKEKDADGSCMDIMCIVDRGIHRQSKI